MHNQRMVESLHSRWLEPDEPKVARKCDQCGDEIYEGEEVLKCENDDVIHIDCKDDWIRNNVYFEREYA